MFNATDCAVNPKTNKATKGTNHVVTIVGSVPPPTAFALWSIFDPMPSLNLLGKVTVLVFLVNCQRGRTLKFSPLCQGCSLCFD